MNRVDKNDAQRLINEADHVKSRMRALSTYGQLGRVYLLTASAQVLMFALLGFGLSKTAHWSLLAALFVLGFLISELSTRAVNKYRKGLPIGGLRLEKIRRTTALVAIVAMGIIIGSQTPDIFSDAPSGIGVWGLVVGAIGILSTIPLFVLGAFLVKQKND